MLDSLQSPAVLLLIATAGLVPVPVRACGLDHCPRPKLSTREAPSMAWSADHTDLAASGPDSRYTQGSLHLRLPFAARWTLGGHLPIGYLAVGPAGQWGMGNPMVYGEWETRPLPAQALTLGLQAELPLGDAPSGIASAHAMAMPFAAYALRLRPVIAHFSLGFAAQFAGGHGHEDEDPSGIHDHADHASAPSVAGTAVDPVPVVATPHAPYEFQFRATAGLPLAGSRLEAEAGISGARGIEWGEGMGTATDYVALEGALGLRPSGGILLRLRGKRELDGPARFAWSTGLDLRFEFNPR